MTAPFIPAWLDDLGLDSREFRVYCHVLRRGECWEASEEIAEHCRMNRKTVYAVLSRLEARGLVEVEHRPGRTTVYRPRLPSIDPQEFEEQPIPKEATGEADPTRLRPQVGVPKQATGRGDPFQFEPHPPVPKLPTEGLTREGIKYTPPTPPQPPSRRDDGLRPSSKEPPPPPTSQPSQETLEHLAKFAAVPMRILSAIGPEKLEDWGRGYTKEEISAAWEQAKSGATKSHRAYFEAILDGKTAFDPEILAKHTGRKHVAGPEELPPEQHPARLAAQQWRVGDLVSYQGQPKRVVRIDDIWLDLEDGTYVQAYLARRWTGEPAVA